MTEYEIKRAKALYEKICTLRDMIDTPECTKFSWEHDLTDMGCPDHLWQPVPPELNSMFLNVVEEYLVSMEKEFRDL